MTGHPNDPLTPARTLPVRTCVGCRARVAKAELLRVAVVEGSLVPDPAARVPGRGAYVHPDLACLDLAERRRAFPRALRLPGPLPGPAVREWLMSSSSRSGQLGHDVR